MARLGRRPPATGAAYVQTRVVLAPIRVTANGGPWWWAAAGASSSGLLPTANLGRGRRVTVAGAAARAKKIARRARHSESSSVPGGLISGASASRGIQRLLLLASRPATLTALRALWRSSRPAALAPALLLSSRRSHGLLRFSSRPAALIALRALV
jgi:hypothetical protein